MSMGYSFRESVFVATSVVICLVEDIENLATMLAAPFFFVVYIFCGKSVEKKSFYFKISL